MAEEIGFSPESRYVDLGSFSYEVTEIEDRELIHCRFSTDEGGEGSVVFGLENLSAVDALATSQLFVGTHFHLHETKDLDSGAIMHQLCVEPVDVEAVVEVGMNEIDQFLSENLAD